MGDPRRECAQRRQLLLRHQLDLGLPQLFERLFQLPGLALLRVPQALLFQTGAQTSSQQDRIERFGEVILRSQRDTVDDAREVVDSRDHDNRNTRQRGIGLHLLQDRHTVHLRHLDVQQHEVHWFSAQQFQGHSAILRGDDPMSQVRHPTRQQKPGCVIVVNDQHGPCQDPVRSAFMTGRLDRFCCAQGQVWCSHHVYPVHTSTV